MFTNSSFANTLEEYRWQMMLWTAATLLAVVSNLVVALHVLLGTIFFLLAAAAITTAGISCAYALARDSI